MNFLHFPEKAAIEISRSLHWTLRKPHVPPSRFDPNRSNDAHQFAQCLSSLGWADIAEADLGNLFVHHHMYGGIYGEICMTLKTRRIDMMTSQEAGIQFRPSRGRPISPQAKMFLTSGALFVMHVANAHLRQRC
jgi:hypothetical protein